MELQEALSRISEIRLRLADAQTFRGYRAAPVAFSGLVAAAAAGVQGVMLPEAGDPAHLTGWVALWIGVAAVSIAAAAADMALRTRWGGRSLDADAVGSAVQRFLPCLAAGALLTAVVAGSAPEAGWMLPGLWQMLFALGIFASRGLLPPAIVWPGVFYLMAGAGCLMWARGEHALSPWAMGLPFAVGQTLTAAVLYFVLERDHAQEQESDA